MKLLIVIVNYRSADLTIQCLKSLADEIAGIASCKVVVVENASGEASVLECAISDNYWGGWCELMKRDDNAGFAAGNNAAIHPALNGSDPPEFTMLLNPDTEVHPGSVVSLLEFMESNSGVGIAGSRLEWKSGEGQRSARRFPSVASELESNIRLGLVSRLLAKDTVTPEDPKFATQTDWVVGAAMMIRKDVFDSIGLLDEDYFLYFEEVDYCLRALRSGWSTWYVPESCVTHHVGHSTGVTSKVKRGRCPRYWFDSRRIYFLKNYGWTRLYSANIASILGLSFVTVREWISRKPRQVHDYFLLDFIRYSFSFDLTKNS